MVAQTTLSFKKYGWSVIQLFKNIIELIIFFGIPIALAKLVGLSGFLAWEGFQGFPFHSFVNFMIFGTTRTVFYIFVWFIVLVVILIAGALNIIPIREHKGLTNSWAEDVLFAINPSPMFEGILGNILIIAAAEVLLRVVNLF